MPTADPPRRDVEAERTRRTIRRVGGVLVMTVAGTGIALGPTGDPGVLWFPLLAAGVYFAVSFLREATTVDNRPDSASDQGQ